MTCYRVGHILLVRSKSCLYLKGENDTKAGVNTEGGDAGVTLGPGAGVDLMGQDGFLWVRLQFSARLLGPETGKVTWCRAWWPLHSNCLFTLVPKGHWRCGLKTSWPVA